MAHENSDRPSLTSPADAGSSGEWDELGPSWFRFDVVRRELWWSPSTYRLYGYDVGSVTPTLALVYRHKHPDDRVKFRRLFERSLSTGVPFSFEHRIIDTGGRQVATITAARAERWDASGAAPAILTGVNVDVSGVPRAHYAAGSATPDGLLHEVATMAEGLESRTIIGRATGILMVRLGIDSDEAFALLRSRSQHFNVKLRRVAEVVNHTGRLPVNQAALTPRPAAVELRCPDSAERAPDASVASTPRPAVRRRPPGRSLAAG